MGGFSLEKDHDAQYFTTDTLEVIFYKAHPNFPLALHIKVRVYIIYLTQLTTVQTLLIGHIKSYRYFNQELTWPSYHRLRTLPDLVSLLISQIFV